MEKLSKDEILDAIKYGVRDAIDLMLGMSRQDFRESFLFAIRDGVKDAISASDKDVFQNAVVMGVENSLEHVDVNDAIKKGVTEAIGVEFDMELPDFEKIIRDAVKENLNDD